MIKKILISLGIIFGFCVLSFGYAIGVSSCATKVYADNSQPTLKAYKPSPDRLENDNLIGGDVYKWIDSNHIGHVPDADSLQLQFDSGSGFYSEYVCDYGVDIDCSNISDSEESSMWIEWDNAGYLTFSSGDESTTFAYFGFDDSTGLCNYVSIYYDYICFADGIIWNDSYLGNLITMLLVPYDYQYPVQQSYSNIYVNNNLIGNYLVGSRYILKIADDGNGIGIREFNNNVSGGSMIYVWSNNQQEAGVILSGFRFGGPSYVYPVYTDGYIFSLGDNDLYLYTYSINVSSRYDYFYDSGYEDGYYDGSIDGYQEGLNDNSAYQNGLNDNANAQLNNVWDTLFSMVNSFFSQEIFPGFKLVYMLYIALGGIGIAIAIKLWVH